MHISFTLSAGSAETSACDARPESNRARSPSPRLRNRTNRGLYGYMPDRVHARKHSILKNASRDYHGRKAYILVRRIEWPTHLAWRVNCPVPSVAFPCSMVHLPSGPGGRRRLAFLYIPGIPAGCHTVSIPLPPCHTLYSIFFAPGLKFCVIHPKTL